MSLTRLPYGTPPNRFFKSILFLFSFFNSNIFEFKDASKHLHSKNFKYSVFHSIVMKQITLVIIVLLVIVMGACIASAHPSDRQLPGPHDASVDIICAGSVAHPQISDLRLDLVMSSIQHNFHDRLFDHMIDLD